MAEKRKKVDLAKLREKQLKYLRELQGPPTNAGVGNNPRPNPYPIYTIFKLVIKVLEPLPKNTPLPNSPIWPGVKNPSVLPPIKEW